MPRAASTTERSTSRMPTYAFVSRGGTANSTRAATVGRYPALRSGETMKSASTAKTGTARPTLETFTARVPPRPRWPRYRPTGSAIAQATASATPLT